MTPSATVIAMAPILSPSVWARIARPLAPEALRSALMAMVTSPEASPEPSRRALLWAKAPCAEAPETEIGPFTVTATSPPSPA